MLCSTCKKNPASVHFKSVINDQVTQWDLCPSCAQEKGIPFMLEEGFPLGPAPFQSLSELIAQLADDVTTDEQKQMKIRCRHCGLTYPEFHVRGRFGCAHCYDAFQSYVDPLLRRIHGQTAHTGKVYEPPASAHDAPAGGGAIKTREIQQLEKELKEAVRREEFEKAAKIRDRLHALKERTGDQR